MSLYRFFKPVKKFPDPNGDLSAIVPPAAIREANKEVAKVMEAAKCRKRKPYKKISDSLRAQIGGYALENGNAAAVRRFSKEFETSLSESTVRSLKKGYISARDALKRKSDEDTTLESLPPKKRGRPLLLSESIDKQVQAYVKNSREQGCIVNSTLVIAAARGILKKCDSSLAKSNENGEMLTKSWAKSVLIRMGFVKRKGTTTAKVSPENFENLKETFLEQIRSTVMC